MSGKIRLGIDTSCGRIALPSGTDTGAAGSSRGTATVALARGGGLVLSRSFDGARQAESVLSAIQELLRGCPGGAIPLAGIDEIILTIGPGSFTGMRTALATVAGLAWQRQVPVTGVSNLLLPFADAGGSSSLLSLVRCAADEWFAFAAAVEQGAESEDGSAQRRLRLTPLTPVVLISGDAIEPLKEHLALYRQPAPEVGVYDPERGAEQLVQVAGIELLPVTPVVPREQLESIPGLVIIPDLQLLQRAAGGSEIHLLYGKGANARTLIERGLHPRGVLPSS